MAKFEKVSRFADVDIAMPERKTAKSAGYDFVVAEDIILTPYDEQFDSMIPEDDDFSFEEPRSLDEVAALTKKFHAKPTLVSTGMKCQLDDNQYLQLSIRSSCPLKDWLVLANGVGIIDADYYNNPDNEGEIFLQIINFSPYPIYLKQGDRIGQGIIMEYIRTEDDAATAVREGGFGSTGA